MELIEGLNEVSIKLEWANRLQRNVPIIKGKEILSPVISSHLPVVCEMRKSWEKTISLKVYWQNKFSDKNNVYFK